MTGDQARRNIEELAALYASGALPADERAAVEARLAAGDEHLRAAIEASGTVIEALGMAGGAIAPSPEIRQRLLDRAAEGREMAPDNVDTPQRAVPLTEATVADSDHPLRTRPRRRDRQPSGGDALWPAATADQTGELELVLASTAEWTAMAEGAEVRVLHFDRRARRVTMLARLAPGTIYPPHFHREGEECVVVEGDLIVGEHVLGPGDYQFAPADTWHGAQTTSGGCVCVIITSLANLDRAILERLLHP